MPSNHLILCRPLLPPLIFPSIRVFSNKSALSIRFLPPLIFPSIRVFSNKSALSIRWPKCQTFSFNISPSNEYSGWTAWISLLSKVLSRAFSNTTVQKYQFFGTQLSLWSNSHIHTRLLEKTIAWTRWTFVGKVMSLLFNKLSRLVITFLPRSKCLLISWLQSPSAVILEPPKIGVNWSVLYMGSIPFLAVWLDHRHVPNFSELSCLNYLLLLCNLPPWSYPEESRKCYRASALKILFFF